jgi:hypothetical protein
LIYLTTEEEKKRRKKESDDFIKNYIDWEGYDQKKEDDRVRIMKKKNIYSARGFHGVVYRPTRFIVGEGYRPERVDITPIRRKRSQSIFDIDLMTGLNDPNGY